MSDTNASGGPNLHASTTFDGKGVKDAETAVAQLKIVAAQISTSIDEVMKALPKKATPALEQLKSALSGWTSAVDTVRKNTESSVDTLAKNLVKSGQAAGKNLAKGVADGLKSGTAENVSIVKAQAVWLQKSYEEALRAGSKFSARDIADFRAWGVNVGADAKAAIHDGMLKAKSATRMSENDVRALLGMPSRDEMRTATALIKAQILQSQREVAQVAKATAHPVGAYSVLSGPDARTVVNTAAAARETDRLRVAQSELNKTLRDGHSAARGLASGFGAMWLTWGNIVPLMAGAAISNSFVQIVKAGAEVEQSLTRIRVLAGESADTVGVLEAQMMELARTGPFGPVEISKAMEVLALAGLDAAEASSAVRDVLNFSLAGDIGLKQAADALTSIGTSFRIGADGYGYVSNVISKAAAESKSSVEDFSSAMKTASVINLQYGVTLEETAVGIALLNNAGIRGTAAGTALRNVYADLSGRTKAVTVELQKLGVTAIDPLTGKMRATKDVFLELMDALSKKRPDEAFQSIRKIFSERGEKEAMAVLNALSTQVKRTGKDVATVYDDLMEKVKNSAGFAAIAAAEMSLTPLNQMKSVASSLQAAMVEVFDSLQPYVLRVSNDLKRLFQSEEFKGGLRDVVVGIGSVVTSLMSWSKELLTVFLLYKMGTSVLGVLNAIRIGTLAVAAASQAAGVAFTEMGIVARAATLANPLLRGLSAVIAGAAAVWGFYEMHKDRALEKSPAQDENTASLIEALEKELRHLNNVNEAREKNISLMELESQQKALIAKANSQSEVDRARAVRDQAAQALRNAGARPSGNGIMGAAQLNAYDAVVEDFERADAAFRAASEKSRAEIARLDELRRAIVEADARNTKALREKLERDKNILGDPLAPSTIEGLGEAATSAAKGLELYASLTEEASGFDRSWTQDVNSLVAAFNSKDEKVKLTYDQLVEGVDLLLKRQPLMKAADKEAADALKEQTKLTEDYAKAQQRTLETSLDEVTKAQEAYDNHGKLASVLQEEALARLENWRIEMAMGGEDTAVIDAQIANKRRLISILRNGEVRDASEQAAKDMTADQKRAAEESAKFWEDALMRAFESGKGFFQSLWDTIKNTLKTQVLKVMVSATGLTGMTAAAAGESGGFGSSLSFLTGIDKLTTNIGSLAGAFNGSGLAEFAKSGMGQSLGLSHAANVPGIAESGATLTGVGNVFASMPIGGMMTAYSVGGVKGFAAGVASTALAGGVAASIAGTGFAAGAMGALTAIGPWGWAAMAGLAVLGGMKNKTPSRGTGEATLTYDSLGNVTNTNLGSPNGGGLTELANGVITNMSNAYFSTAKALGITAAEATFGFGGNTGKDSKGANFALWSGANGVSYTGSNNNSQSYTPEQLQLEASRAVFSALQASELPNYLSGIFDGITASTATQEQIDNVLGYAKALSGFHAQLTGMPEGFQNLADASYSAMNEIIGLSGGLDALQANINAYYTNFYTDEERRAQAIININKTIGISGFDAATTSKEQFRALVEAQDLSTESGRKMYSTLMSVSQAFSEVSFSSKALVDSISSLVGDSIYNMQYGMADDRGKYNMLDVQAKGYDDKMREATALSEIAKFAQAEIETINKAWSLLDADQQKASYSKFEQRLEEIDGYVKSRGADADSIQEAKDKKTADAISAAVKIAVAEALGPSAVAMQAAADKAQEPIVVESHITVSAPEGSEVSIA